MPQKHGRRYFQEGITVPRAAPMGHFLRVRRRISMWLQFMDDGARDWRIFDNYFFLGVLAVKL
jgi:hypothetical protein